MNKGQQEYIQFVVARGPVSKLLEAAEQSFDGKVLGVAGLIVCLRVAALMLERNHG